MATIGSILYGAFVLFLVAFIYSIVEYENKKLRYTLVVIVVVGLLFWVFAPENMINTIKSLNLSKPPY